MITSVKKYGSYLLTKNCLYEEDILDDPTTESFVSSCTIPPHWIDLPLLRILPYNHDTSIFRFALPPGAIQLRLPIGAFFFILAPESEHDGSDAIRPYTSITDDDLQNNPSLHPMYETVPSFDLLCKRYDAWGIKENAKNNFLFTRTDHSYRPPGAVSNYLHRLKVGDKVKFKHNKHCLGRIPYPFPGITKLMMIAVGVGVAPMIQILRHLLKEYNQRKNREESSVRLNDGSPITLDDIDFKIDHENSNIYPSSSQIENIVLFYGVRTVKDILLRETLEKWQREYSDFIKIVFCVGSRWNNIHFGAKKKGEYIPPPLPEGFNSLQTAVLGWINEEKILKYGLSPSNDTKVLVCGLPGVYEKLCGVRNEKELSQDSVLFKLGYTADMVIKM